MMRKLRQGDFVRARSNSPELASIFQGVGRIVEIERSTLDDSIRYWVNFDKLQVPYPYPESEAYYFRHYELWKVWG